jgi:hypothetical protein
LGSAGDQQDGRVGWVAEGFEAEVYAVCGQGLLGHGGGLSAGASGLATKTTLGEGEYKEKRWLVMIVIVSGYHRERE